MNHTTNGTTVYEFDPKDGPVCLWGDTYRVLVRDAKSENLLIYMEGGGMCVADLCVSKTTANSVIPSTGTSDNATTTNVVASWNVVEVPSCDGSHFSDDNEVQATGPSGSTQTRYHHGLENLTAALDLAKTMFPNPKRILIAGSSAGGYGSIVGTLITRFEYPHTDLLVFNDAGLGLYPSDPTAFDRIKSEWKFDQFVPDSCAECQNAPQTALIAWALRNDPTLKVSAFSSYGDSSINGLVQSTDFKALLLAKIGAVHDEFPTRFERFFVAGSAHTSLFLDQAAHVSQGNFWGYLTLDQGMSVSDFMKALNATPDWKDHLDTGDAGP